VKKISFYLMALLVTVSLALPAMAGDLIQDQLRLRTMDQLKAMHGLSSATLDQTRDRLRDGSCDGVPAQDRLRTQTQLTTLDNLSLQDQLKTKDQIRQKDRIHR
jgi:hypothetical protein